MIRKCLLRPDGDVKCRPASVGLTIVWSVRITSADAIALRWPLYLLLVTVSDAEGLSYYSTWPFAVACTSKRRTPKGAGAIGQAT